MDRPRSPRRTPRPPDSITGAAKRYHACAYAFATTLGIPLAEALRDYHGPITAIYIEVCRGDLRVPAGVSLPPLVNSSIVFTHGQGQGPDLSADDHEPPSAPDATPLPPGEASPNGQAPVPVVVPQGFPSAGVRISALKAAVLHMLVSKTAALLHGEERERWVALHAALQRERAARLERGRKPRGEG